ncbi:uncharacterized protein LOC124472382 [Hypomesus transpacificus]|uniref:uncharacterized protein LOC124472382 n=1 Tax=Hypomesus transpacificus TaxID=137520 RepID=UPI001F07218A|nr:uncharacterized protein LOC124472382 [Hypomesus transpacificus]
MSRPYTVYLTPQSLQNMSVVTVAFLLGFTTTLFSGAGGQLETCRGSHCFPPEDWSTACVGAHCQGRREAAPRPSTPDVHRRHSLGRVRPVNVDAHTGNQRPSAAVPFTVIQPGTATGGTKRLNPRTVTAEVFHPGCRGGTCHGSPRPTGRGNEPQECKGFECELPLRKRPQPCAGDSCSAGGEDPAPAGRERSAPVHMTDRAAQFLGEIPELPPERGASPPGIQLTCDIKPGSSEAPSEDALVLQLRLSQDQEQLLGSLRSQQEDMQQLQQHLNHQQGALISQQKDILEQQDRMFQQMTQVKEQYTQLLENVKQLNFLSLQGELESQLDSMRTQAAAHHTQQGYAAHQVDMQASVMEVGLPLQGCGGCAEEQFCSVSTGGPGCESCTICPPGFFLVSHCSIHSDRVCQDRDECLEMSSLCGEQLKCLNTPGGFRCQGMSEREGGAGMCGHAYFYSAEMEECQACSDCEGQPPSAPCSSTSDTICPSSSPSSSSSSSPSSSSSTSSLFSSTSTSPSEAKLSLSWSGDVTLPSSSSAQGSGQSFPMMRLQILGRGPGGPGGSGGVVRAEQGGLVFRQHGLVWLDGNLAISHGCRSFVQLCVRLNASEGVEGRDLSGVRVEQREGRGLQSASVSAVAEVAPGHVLSLLLRSASHHCNHSSDGLRLHDPSATPLSLLWLSHDTGAVAMTAQATASAHYHTSYRPTFQGTVTSDPYVVALTHDGRGVRFAEAGSVRLVFRQALYSMGAACVSEGFQVLAYLNRNATGVELGRAFRPGVHYRDTSVTLATAATVAPGDTLAFEVLAPAQCNVRYFGDETGISAVGLLWVPAALSATLHASLAPATLPSGAVRNKPLLFRQTSQPVGQVALVGGEEEGGRDFLFRERGTASISLELRLIHSCNLVRVTLLGRGPEGAGGLGGPGGGRPVPLGQQVGGQMAEGSRWASLALRASALVQNGTAVFFTLDCIRGRVNHISHQEGSGVAVMWVAG